MDGYYSGRILLALTVLLCLLSIGSSLPTKDEAVDTIDQIILKAAKESIKDLDPFESSDVVRTEYDMMLTPQQWEKLQPSGGRQKRTAALNGEFAPRWIDHTLYYELQPDVFEQRDKKELKKAMREISHYTCIDFKRSRKAENRTYIGQGEGGCYSYVGMVGGKQDLGLGEGCRAKQTIIHELCHALGLVHEQSRADRDDHLTIHFDRIPDHLESQFRVFDWDTMNSFGLPYDYLSVMHYGPTSFAENDGDITMETKDPDYQLVIGASPGLSLLDIRTLNSLYSCVPESCPLKDEDCRAGGFVGKDCKCWCPGHTRDHPVEYCGIEDFDEFGSLDFKYKCKDNDKRCPYYASLGLCELYPSETMYECELTCNYC